MKSLFVTVGSTSFPKLTDLFLSFEKSELLSFLVVSGVKQLVVQRGNVEYHNGSVASKFEDIAVSHYDYKQDLTENYLEADLIISHAGSGSIIESLRLKKKLIVVINADLMNNHQLELAQKLESLNYLITCSPEGLPQTLKKVLCSQDLEFAEFPSQTQQVLQECLSQLL